MPLPAAKGDDSSPLAMNLTVIRGRFAAALREKGYQPSTVRAYLAVLCRAARFLARAGESLVELRREDVLGLIRRLLRRRQPRHHDQACRSPLHAWLKFHGRFAPPVPRFPWQSWLDDYAQFLADVRGLAPITRTGYVNCARAFMGWQFGKKRAHWSRVLATDIWRYGERCASAKRHKPSYIHGQLSALRQFLSFVHLQGACAAQLCAAVPRIRNFGPASSSDFLTDRQRRCLLSSFDLRSATGRRDHAMALCMVDLGFRAIEVVRLRLSDLDWERAELDVPAAKASRGRRLPLPRHVAQALRGYIDCWRPASVCPQVFLGHCAPTNRPITTMAVRTAMHRAYRRCGFPKGWGGTHRLRRTFATRLYAHGINLKQIADLLGHRQITATTRYAQTDLSGLRAVAQPWPR